MPDITISGIDEERSKPDEGCANGLYLFKLSAPAPTAWKDAFQKRWPPRQL